MKHIASFFLAVLILFTGLFILARVQGPGSEQNFFNSNLRGKLSRFAIARQIFGLHDYGDARGDYLGAQPNQLDVVYYAPQDFAPDTSVLQGLADKMQAATGKTVSFYQDPQSFPIGDNLGVSDADLNYVFGHIQNLGLESVPHLYIFFATRKIGEPGLLGDTYNETGVVLYADSIKAFAGGSLDLFNAYEASTALHEFGHQLGLRHNNNPGCLMNPEAETGGVAKFRASDVVSNFCQFELDQISAIRSVLP